MESGKAWAVVGQRGRVHERSRWRSGQVESGGRDGLEPEFWPSTNEQDAKKRAKMAGCTR